MVREQLRGDMELVGEIQAGLGGEHADDSEALKSVSMCMRIIGEHLTPDDGLLALSTTPARRFDRARPGPRRSARRTVRDAAVEQRKRRMAEARAVQALATSLEELGYITVPPNPGEVCRFRTPSGAQYAVQRPPSGRLHPRHVEPVLAVMLRAEETRRTPPPLNGLTIVVPHDDPHGPNEPMN